MVGRTVVDGVFEAAVEATVVDGAAIAALDADAFGFVKVCMYATSAGLVFEKNFARSSGRVCINDSNNVDICLSSHVCIGVVGGKFSVVSGFVCISGIDSVGMSIAFVFVQCVFNRA